MNSSSNNFDKSCVIRAVVSPIHVILNSYVHFLGQ
jgi:hypothetical protein